MAVNGSGWTGINEDTNSGNDVEDKLTSAFDNIDADLNTLDTDKADIADVAVIEKELTIRVDKIAADVDTIIVAGMYEVGGANIPVAETTGVMNVKAFDASVSVKQFLTGGTGIEYSRKSSLGDGSDWTAWVEQVLSARVTANEDAIVVLQTPPTLVTLTPVSVTPTYGEAQFYYFQPDGTFRLQGPFEGVEVDVGHGEHIHVLNNSGVKIDAGTAVRIAGASGGNPVIVLALADTFENANVLGIVVADILDGELGAVATSGIVRNQDTSLLTAGEPYFLSDTIAGALTLIPPVIRTRVGGVLLTDASAGKFRMDLAVNQNTPGVLGVLQGQAGAGSYPLTAIPTTVLDYATAESIVTPTNITTGEITLPNDGAYRLHVTADITFAAVASTREIIIELYDVTGAVVHFPYTKSIPRDATGDALSFSWVLGDEVAGRIHTVRMSSVDNFTVILTEISFDISSISIRI